MVQEKIFNNYGLKESYIEKSLKKIKQDKEYKTYLVNNKLKNKILKTKFQQIEEFIIKKDDW